MNLTQQQLQNLTANMRGTNWSNPRIEDGQLLADYTGELFYSHSNTRQTVYNGVTTCEINVWPILYKSIKDFKDEQSMFIRENMDWAPLPYAVR